MSKYFSEFFTHLPYKRHKNDQFYKIKMDIQDKSSGYHFFLDVSGSVGGSSNYWDTVNDLFNQYESEIERIFFWDHMISPGTKQQLRELIKNRRGNGGTEPTHVADTCIQLNLKNIILITDGQVSQNEVSRCDQILMNHKFDKTICYIISTNTWARGQNDLNMSITCSFSRNCETKVFIKKHDVPLQPMLQINSNDYSLLENLEAITLENFEAHYDKIEQLIIAVNMGKDGNIPLKNSLVLIKNRLIREFSQKKGGQKKNIGLVVRQFLEKGDFNSAIKQMQSSFQNYKEDQVIELQNKITYLISLCGDLKGKFTLNEIKSNKMAIAQQAKKGKLDNDVDINELSKNLIECPILNEDDVPQILVDQCQPLLKGVEKSIADDIVACPLRILNYPHLKAKLKSRLSNYVGVMGINAKFDVKLLKNPFTQNKLLGSIPLGSHKSHIKVGNYTISKLITDGKILGNMNMYYAVIWYLIQQKSIEYLRDIEPNATQHLIYRLKSSKCYASMSGQAQFLNIPVPTDIAVWYCVNSGFLNLPTNKDSFRFHFYNLQPMFKIVETLGYPCDKGLMAHYHRTNALLGIMSVLKSIRSEHDKRSLQNVVKGLYQNGVFINPKQLSKKFVETEKCSTFVLVDGPASSEQVEKIRTLLGEKYSFTKPLTNEEVFYLCNNEMASKNFSNYFLDYNIEIPPLPQPETNWKYGIEDFELPKICPKTLRPYSNKKESVKEQCSGNQKSTLKEYKYFEQFVFKYDKLPTVDELILFYYNRHVVSGKHSTLPCVVAKWSGRLIEEYQPYFESLSVKKVKRVLNEFREVAKRVKVESQN